MPPSLTRAKAAQRRMHGNNSMKPLQRVAFIGNHLPRRCGIATFTHDLHRAVSTARPDLETCVVAMTDPGRTYDYPPAVRFQIHDETIDDYVQAAEFLNNGRFRRCFPSTRIRNFRRRGRRKHHRAPVAPRNADRDDASHRASQTDAHPARRDASDHRCFRRRSLSCRKKAANSSVPFMTCQLARSRSYRTEYPTSRFSKRITPRRNSASPERRHSDVRSPVAKQRHRDRDRCHAGNHQILPECRLCHSRRDPSESRAASGRGLSRELDGARAGTRHRGPCRLSSTSSSIRPRCWTSFRCATSM